MYNLKKHRPVFLALIFLVLAVAACGTSTQAQPTMTAIPPVDMDSIVEAVTERVEARLESQDTVITAAANVDELAALVKAEVEAQLDGQYLTAAPTPDPTDIANDIADVVLAQVEAKLEQQSSSNGVDNTDAAAIIANAEIEDALIRLYQQANPAVVYIVIPSVGSGSGFVYNSDGIIVTNNHVVENGGSYEVVFSTGERTSARLIGTDVDSDLAVIKVDQLPAGVQPLPLAEADDIAVGQFVVAIGNPFGEQGSMSLGIVSGLGRSLPSQREPVMGSSYSLPQVIQTDAPINPGNSGGPLLNLKREVVGVNSAIASTTGTNSGVGFSIPVAAVRRIIPNLVEKGEYVYPYMGASFDSEITLNEKSELGLSQTLGAYVLGTSPGGPADAAGLIAANPTTRRGGDLIVAIDGQEISDFSDLNGYLAFHTAVGQIIQVVVLRGDQRVTLPLTLGARP